jgi:hypothetical protein
MTRKSRSTWGAPAIPTNKATGKMNLVEMYIGTSYASK